MIKAVCFDLDDTLFDYRGTMSGCEKYLCRITGAYLGIPLQRCLMALNRVKKDLYRSRPLDPEVFDWRIRMSQLLSTLGREADPDIVESLLNDFWKKFLLDVRPYPDMIGIMGYLVREGMVTSIISNGIRDQQEDKVARLGIDELISHRIYSEDVGKNKPAPAIFREAIKHIGTRPDETLMVGDLCYVDIKGAKEAGFHTCWFRAGAYSNLYPKNEGEEPEFTIDALSKLKSIV
jgi:putative hydrolase of the HAD superfamily